VAGMLTRGTDGRHKVAGGGTVKSGGGSGGRGRTSRSPCKGGRRRVRVRIGQGNAGGATRARGREWTHRWRRIAAVGGDEEGGGGGGGRWRLGFRGGGERCLNEQVRREGEKGERQG
jgi:hypothetical protein